jgi:hypothetical protein
MTRTLTAMIAGGLVMSACATAPIEEARPMPQPAPPPPDASYVPAGTHLNVTLEQELNTTDTRAGDSFIVVVNEPLVAANGQTVVPAETRIQGMVTGVAQPGGRDPAALRLQFVRIELNDDWVPFNAEIAGTSIAMERHTDHDQHVRAAATGAAVGAAAGAVISGGRLRDALIGAALGAGAGTIISLGVGTADEAVLPAETQMTLRTLDRINVR